MLEFRSKGSAVRDSRNSEAAEVAVQWLSGRQEHASRDGAWYEGPTISDARLAVLFSEHQLSRVQARLERSTVGVDVPGANGLKKIVKESDHEARTNLKKAVVRIL